MPRLSRMWVVALLVAALPFLPSRPRAAETVVVVQRTYSSSDLTLEPVPGGSRVALAGLPSEARLDRGEWPVDTIRRQAPEGMRLREVEVTAVEWTAVAWAEPTHAPRADASHAPTEVEASLRAAAPAADPVAEQLFGGYFRGRRIESIAVRPVRVGPEPGTLEVASSVELRLVYEPDPDAPVPVREVNWVDGSGFDVSVSRLVGDSANDAAIKPDRAARFSPQTNGSQPFSPRFRPSEDGSPVQYLILTSDALSGPFQELANWKTSLGIPTVVRTLSWIHANYPVGVDEAEDVRNFIRNAVGQWGVEYVLIGGDVDVIPIRFAKSYFYGGEFIPTDQYYACLDGNWNANGNDLFGEPYVSSLFVGDAVDLYPEVWVGRAPVRTADEAQTFVNKVKAYESSAPLGAGFGETVLAFAEVFFPQNWSQGDTVVFDGALLAETAYATAVGTDFERLYENHVPYPGSLPETKQAVINEINAGYNMLLHIGHGYRNTMAVGIGGETLTNGDADKFYNGNRQGILYAINCTSSALDFDCIAEHFVRNRFGGVVGTVGSTRLDFPATGRYYQDEFFDLIYQQDITRVGEAAAMQKLPFVGNSISEGEHRWTQFNLIYLGDPTLDLYNGPVSQMSVTVDEPFELGQDLYTVHVSDGSGPVAGAVVCLSKPGDAYGVGVTDVSGTAFVPFEPDSVGAATLGVRAHDRRSRVDTITVNPGPGPHLYVVSLTVDDAAGGDGDGALEAGETAYLHPLVANQGASTASGVTVSLVSVPAGVTVLDGTAAVPDLGGGLSATSLDPLQIAVGTGVGDLSVLETGLEIAAAGYLRDDPLVLYVGAPVLDLYATALRDTIGNGDGNGILQANEDHHLRLHYMNKGVGRSEGLTAVLSTTDPAVTILDGTSSYGDIEGGETGGGDGFAFRFADNNLNRPLTVTLSDQRGVVSVRTINLSKPATPTSLSATGAESSITLKWTRVNEADMRGYQVFRSAASGGPFAPLNPVATDRVSYFKDENLPPLTRFYYKVAAVDSSGNHSAQSILISATTSLPAATGFPLIVGASVSSSPAITYLSGDDKADIVTGGNEIYAVLHDGKEWIDGDGDAQTYGTFSDTGFGPFWSPPAVGDLDGDGIPEIASCGWSSGFLYVWESHGDVKPGWPRNLNIESLLNISAWGAPAFADVDGDGRMEIFVNAGRYTFGFNDDGTEIVDGDANPLTHGVFNVMGASANYSSPALADIDNDGAIEIIVGSRDGKLYVMEANGADLPGFPFVSGGDITGSPAIGDIDNDGLKEMVFGNGNFQVHAINKNLAQPPGWPTAANMNKDFDASPALADLNGDGYLDVIVCAGNGTVYAYQGQNGALLPGFGFIIVDGTGTKIGISSSPAVGNLDADPQFEICFGGNDGNLYAYNHDGTLVAGFPIGTDNSIEGGPCLWDIDGDGLTEVVAQSYDEQMYVWDSPGPFDPANQPWPMFRQNSRRTGEVNQDVWVALDARDPGPTPRPVLAPNAPNPFSSATRIFFALAGDAAASQFVDLSIFDVQGRRVRTLLREERPNGEYEVSFDGRDDDGRRLGGGIYFYRLSASGHSWTRKMVLIP